VDLANFGATYSCATGVLWVTSISKLFRVDVWACNKWLKPLVISATCHIVYITCHLTLCYLEFWCHLENILLHIRALYTALVTRASRSVPIKWYLSLVGNAENVLRFTLELDGLRDKEFGMDERPTESYMARNGYCFRVYHMLHSTLWTWRVSTRVGWEWIL
jgi:hypothetical protein